MSRHKWLKLRPHVRICLKCGAGRVSAIEDGEWFVTYHLPTGKSLVAKHVPPCEVGPRTADYLKKHEAAIAVVPLAAPAMQGREASQ